MIQLVATTQGGWHAYKVTFNDEAQALAYITARRATHNFERMSDDQVLGDDLLRAIYPWMFEECSHGLSAWLCADPINHYPADNAY